MRMNIILLVMFAVILGVVIITAAILVRRAEKEKQAALRQVSEAKTEFLSRISNDIKTPMNVIVGMTALGMEDTDNPEKMAECLGKIDTAGKFLMGLLNDLVDVSKIEMGSFRLHPKPCAFDDIIRSIRDMMEPACAKKGITLYMTEGEIGINIMADPMRFEQMLFNLLSNAVKFTARGGEVSFSICNYATHNDMFCADYVIRDNGIGMSSEFQELLFEPFTHEWRDAAEKKHGSGLGLAIVRNIVDLMEGTIEVKSQVGEGTQIKIHLDVPLAEIQPEQSKDHIASRAPEKILSGKRVLLAEDQPMNVDISRDILERKGMLVVSAENGHTAFETFRNSPLNHFDVILMDLQMPQMNGFEAARRIRREKRPDAQIIPIIAMSANDSHEDISACREAGMNGHVAKPVEPQRLYEVICDHLMNPI